MKIATVAPFPNHVPQIETRRVLVVDDDTNRANLTADALRTLGYTANLTNDYEKVVERACEFAADVAIIDIRVGEDDGFELISALRKRLPKILCVLVTGQADTRSAIHALRSGASDYLYKPVEINMLDAVLNRCFDRLRLEAEKGAAERALRESDERFRAFFENTPVCMSIKDLQGRYIKVNDSHQKWLGHSAEVLVGKTMGDVLDDTERAAFLFNTEQTVVETGNVCERETTITHEDGTQYDRIIVKFPIKGDDGIVSTIGTVAIDNSERKQVERKLAESEAQLRLVIDSMPVLIIYIDNKERYVLSNKTGAEWHDTTPDYFIGKTLKEVHGENYARVSTKIRETLNGDIVTFETTIDYSDGITRDVRITNVPDIGSDGRVRGFFGMAVDVTQSRQAERQLKESEARFHAVVDNFPASVYLKDIEGRYLIANRTFRDWLNVETESDCLGKTIHDFFPPDPNTVSEAHDQKVIKAGKAVIENREQTYPDGITRKTWIHRFPIFGADGGCAAIGSVNMDVTDQHNLQNQLIQAQKMEAVGQLTGGVAHDFNNLLGVIIGNLDFMAEEYNGNAELAELIAPAMKAALSGANLNRQLLAFSRKQALSPKVIDLNHHVTGILDMLRRTLGETIEIDANLEASGWTTEVDPVQLENVLLNLAVNARDAMQNGGNLRIKTSKAHLGLAYTSTHPGVAPGDYLVLSVTDTGIGMTPDVLEHAFDPFFTTKGVGEGSGLGLSMVFGFTKQSGGHAEIKSRAGKGTTVNVYLPEVVLKAAVSPNEASNMPTAKGETILIVEDDPGILELGANMLSSLGYTVMDSGNGSAALEILDGASHVDLLLTDVVMPGGISGPELAKLAKDRCPDIKTIYMSGYTADKLSLADQENCETPLLLKPFRRTVLAKTLRNVLEN
jgi:PAS domain S-box-containing protein